MVWKKTLKIEEILIALEVTSRTETRFAEKAKSLMDWYCKYGNLSFHQMKLADELNRQARATGKPKKLAHYHLYAISDGQNVKLGHATTPQTRLKGLQTGSVAELKLIWTLDVGTGKTRAHKAERQLHRYVDKHHKRGEWFDCKCMDMVRAFKVKSEDIRTPKAIEREIVSEARARL